MLLASKQTRVFFLCFVNCASLYNLVNKTNLVHYFSCMFISFYSLHVSGNYVPSIRRNNCINGTPGICHSAWMTFWYASCIPEGQPHRVTNTRCHIDTVIFPVDGHIVGDMQRTERNKHTRKIVQHVGFIYKITRALSEQTKKTEAEDFMHQVLLKTFCFITNILSISVCISTF